jgi:hypothetical protein
MAATSLSAEQHQAVAHDIAAEVFGYLNHAHDETFGHVTANGLPIVQGGFSGALMYAAQCGYDDDQIKEMLMKIADELLPQIRFANEYGDQVGQA